MKSLCLIVDIRLLLLLLKEEEVKDGNTLVTVCVWIPIKKIVFEWKVWNIKIKKKKKNRSKKKKGKRWKHVDESLFEFLLVCIGIKMCKFYLFFYYIFTYASALSFGSFRIWSLDY